MVVRLHPHDQQRLLERGATEQEVVQTVLYGETFPAKHGRTGFRRIFHYNKEWRGIVYPYKQVEAFGIKEGDAVLVITVIVKFF